MMSTLNKNKILEKIFEMGTHDISDRMSYLIYKIKYYHKEIIIKQEYINSGTYNRAILSINYNLVNLINIGLSTFLIIILLIFVDYKNENSSTVFSVMRYLEFFEICLNTTFVILFILSHYKINLELDLFKADNKPDEATIFDKINIYCLKNLLLHEDIAFLIFNELVAIMIIYDPQFFGLLSIQLFAIIKFIRTIKEIFTAFAMTIDQLIGMVAFLAIIILIYSSYSFEFMKADYIIDMDGGIQESICGDLFHCALFHFDSGVRSGGGIGDLLPSRSIHDTFGYSLRYIGDLAFFIIVILLILNMINGIIITTFSQLREENEKRKAELDDKCYICGFDKDKFEKLDILYKNHLKVEHNYFNYVFFLINLEIKPSKEFNKDESKISKSIQKREMKCLPIGLSLSLRISDSKDNKN